MVPRQAPGYASGTVRASRSVRAVRGGWTVLRSRARRLLIKVGMAAESGRCGRGVQRVTRESRLINSVNSADSAWLWSQREVSRIAEYEPESAKS